MSTKRTKGRPVHVLYGGAHLFRRNALEKLSAIARRSMDTHGADDREFARAVGAREDGIAPVLAARVRKKLASARAIESMCIDFEDGYGVRSDEEEDREVDRVARELEAFSHEDVALSVRVKSGPRGVRTLERLLDGTKDRSFSITLPKVETATDVRCLIDALDRLGGAELGIELMIETPRAVTGIGELVEAGGDRLVALHLGAYDLTASLGVTAVDQRLDHPYCDFARTMMAFGCQGVVALVDGATTTMPIPSKDSTNPDDEVRRAWSEHAKNVRRAIDFGMWEGWDLHPAQLPARYGALFGYFLAQREVMQARLRAFVEKKARASRVGQVFDDAATGRGLEEFFRRGLSCGALETSEAT